MKRATQWLQYDSRTEDYKPHHIEMGRAKEDKPTHKYDHVATIWSAMQWKKVYGFYNPKTQKFTKSRIDYVQSRNVSK